MGRARVDIDIRERCLGHKIGGIRKVYDRFEYSIKSARLTKDWRPRSRGSWTRRPTTWCHSPSAGDAMLRVVEGVDDWRRRLQGTAACVEYIDGKLRRRDLSRDVLTMLLERAVATGRFRTWPCVTSNAGPHGAA
jgi:hypothetical protein